MSGIHRFVRGWVGMSLTWFTLSAVESFDVKISKETWKPKINSFKMRKLTHHDIVQASFAPPFMIMLGLVGLADCSQFYVKYFLHQHEYKDRPFIYHGILFSYDGRGRSDDDDDD
jgi:hypothetical protein